ncbi:SPOR domain-containing protein [Aquisediminimonas sediminicola]|uniref:SPOR domain-containing protein n=1 Tax=Alteraquisediminimonas sediminicola TaxID=2676787 RepID=UPI001FE435AD|nr:SPOR domain-containing protein [Aquisediminimonas sediminicola]
MRNSVLVRGVMMTAVIVLAVSTAQAGVKEGVDAWQNGDYPTAVAEWREPAKAGDADAQFNLGQAYKLGRGVPLDLKIAEGWYAKAARQGHQQAEVNYGLVLFQNDDRESALPWIAKSAQRGDPRAQYVYATALFNGDNVGKDWIKAYAYMARAAAAGLPQAIASRTEMEKFITPEQRAQAMTLADSLSAKQLAQSNWSPPQTPGANNSAAKPAADPLPVATPVTASETPEAMAAKPSPKTKSEAKPNPVPIAVQMPPSVPVPVPDPIPTTDPVPETTTVPVPQPAPIAEDAPSPSGNWRVQLGAFADQPTAKGEWTRIKPKIAGLSSLQPYIVKAGSIIRLQAGPIGTKAAADKLCSTAKSARVACFVLKK